MIIKKTSTELRRSSSLFGIQRMKSNVSLSNKKQKSLNVSNNMIIDDEENIITQKNEEIKKLKNEAIDLERKIHEVNLELKNEKEKNNNLIKEKNILIEEKNKT